MLTYVYVHYVHVQLGSGPWYFLEHACVASSLSFCGCITACSLYINNPLKSLCTLIILKIGHLLLQAASQHGRAAYTVMDLHQISHPNDLINLTCTLFKSHSNTERITDKWCHSVSASQLFNSFRGRWTINTIGQNPQLHWGKMRKQILSHSVVTIYN